MPFDIVFVSVSNVSASLPHSSFFTTTVGETFPDEDDDPEALISVTFSLFSFVELVDGGDGVRESVFERLQREDGVV